MFQTFSIVALFSVVAFSTVACGSASSAEGGAASPTSAAMVAPLDGQSYEVKLDTPGEKTENDSLIFTSGKFESSACTGIGFPQWSEYTAKQEGEATTFHAKTKHPSGTTVDWEGTVKGDTISGKMVRVMNGTPANGTFSGKRKH